MRRCSGHDLFSLETHFYVDLKKIKSPPRRARESTRRAVCVPATMVHAMVRLVKTKNCFINLPPHVARGVAGASEVCVSASVHNSLTELQ